MDWECGVGRCKLLHLEWINNKVLMYQSDTTEQLPHTHMCITESLCCKAEIVTTL